MSFDSISSLGLSGVNAAMMQHFAASANLTKSPSSKDKVIVTQKSLPNGGVQASLEKTLSETEDFPSAMVDQINAIYSFRANMISIRYASDVIGTIMQAWA